jgi:hypothetical protein
MRHGWMQQHRRGRPLFLLVAAHTETRNVLSWQKISIFGNIEARNLLFSFCARQTPNGLSVCHIILKKELFGQRFPKMSGNK